MVEKKIDDFNEINDIAELANSSGETVRITQDDGRFLFVMSEKALEDFAYGLYVRQAIQESIDSIERGEPTYTIEECRKLLSEKREKRAYFFRRK